MEEQRMTKFQKQMLTIAAAGALTAVTALPAMAFENEFHGTFTVKTFVSNFDKGGLLLKENTKTNNYTDQRTRIQYTAKASDDLKLVTQFEMNTQWGAGNDTKSGLDLSGGDIDTDGYNVQVKHAYLDFNVGKALNVKAGQQAYKDKFGGLLVDADLPMAYVAYKRGAYTLGLGYSRFNDDNDLVLAGDKTYYGDNVGDLYALDNTFAINKDTKVGFSYYLNRDETGVAATAGAVGEKRINTLGLFGATKLGAVDLSGFVAMQKGYQHTLAGAKTQYHGWAGNVLAKMKVGDGLARAGFLFASGDNNKSGNSNHAWQTLSSDGESSKINSYNESGMMLLVRNTSMGGTSTDDYLRKPITNIALLHAGYNANITEKLYANGNIGMAWLPSSNNEMGYSGSTTNGGSDILGTEVNAEVGYKLYQNLTLKAQAAYVLLGGAYNELAGGDDPADPFTVRLAASYAF
jgi:hypothetical protein